MSTTTTKPEPRTAADARREFSCASEPGRRRIRQVPGQGTIYGQASLLDCIADCPLPAVHHAPSVYSDCDAEDQAQQAAADRGIDQDTTYEPGAELERDAEDLIAQAEKLEYQALCQETFSPQGRKGMRVQRYNARYKRRQAADLRERAAALENADFADLPDLPGAFHCLSCEREFAPGDLDCITGLCWACFENTAVQLHR